MRKSIIVLSLLITQYIALSQSIVYITQLGAGTKNGSSWANALPGDSLQYAINKNANTLTGGQVWVAQGTYYPTKDITGNSKPKNGFDKTFTLKSKILLYGGFAGTETSLLQRKHIDKDANGKIDSWEWQYKTELNGYLGAIVGQVLTIVTYKTISDDKPLVDGFTITKGDQGMSLYASQVQRCVITRCTGGDNSGAGIEASYSTIVDSCFISENSNDNEGGGIGLNSGSKITNSSIVNNATVYNGGGITFGQGGQAISCFIANNYSNFWGGGVKLDGGILSNSVVVNNSSEYDGAGIYMRNGTLIQSTVAQNSSVAKPNYGISLNGINNTIINSLLCDSIEYDGSTDIGLKQYSVYKNASSKVSYNNCKIDLTPLSGIVKPTTFLGKFKNSSDSLALFRSNWNLKGTSKAINAGNPTISSLNIPTLDIYGNQRITLDCIDAGASEYSGRFYISPLGSGTKMGTSWQNSFPIDSVELFGAGEYWFKSGNYTIKPGVFKTYTLSAFTKVYGGFQGTESSTSERKLSDRNKNGTIEPWEFQYETVFDGSNNHDNSYYLLWNLNENSSVLDGITITNTVSALEAYNGVVTNCEIRNCTIPRNSNANFLFLYNNASISNSFIHNNQSDYSNTGLAPLVLTDSSKASFCVITNNVAQFSGGVYMSSNTLLLNSIVSNNRGIEESNGHTTNGGGITANNNAVIKNCLITNNSSVGKNAKGGGMYINGDVKIINSTIANNSCEGTITMGPDLFITNTATIQNSIIGSKIMYNSISTKNAISYSAIVGGFNDIGAGDSLLTIANSTDLLAQFQKPTSFIGRAKTVADTLAIFSANWQLQDNSIFINRGLSNQNVTTTDLNGNTRKENNLIDLGPYEKKITTPVVGKGLKETAQPIKGTVSLQWNKIPAQGYLLFVKEGVAGSASISLTDGSVYKSVSAYGLGSVIDGWYCVYNGIDTVVSVTTLLQGTTYKALLVPYNGTRFSVYNTQVVDNSNIIFFTTKREQTIQLNIPATVQGISDFVANVNATSGLDVQLSSSAPDIFSVNGTKISIIKEGTAVITAIQSGNSQYFAATPVTKSITFSKATQTISLLKDTTVTFGDKGFALTAKATSGLDVQYTISDNNLASISNGWLSLKAAGTVTITAIQPGNSYYTAAKQVSFVVTINKASQVINFTSLSNKTYNGIENFELTAKANSGLEVNYISSNSAILSIAGNIATINGAGTVTIKAYQSGNSNYVKADTVQQSLTIAPKVQSILMDSILTVSYGIEDFTPTVKTESNASVILTSSNALVATIVTGKIHIVGVGTATLTATQVGTANYLPVSTKRIVKVVKSQQIISFTTLPTKTYGDASFILDGKSTSGLALTYTSSDTLKAKITGNLVTILSAGMVDITASQAGNTRFEAATAVVQTLIVNPKNQTISFSKLDTVTYGNIADINPIISSTSGLPISLTSYTPSVAKIVNGKIVIVGAGSTIIEASQSGNTNFGKATEVKQLLVVRKHLQSLKVTPIASFVYGMSDVTVVAESSSKLPITIISTDPSIIKISNNKLQIVQAGTVTITISQLGDNNFEAIDSTIKLTIGKAKQTISFTKIYDHVYGDADIVPVVRASSGLTCALTSSNTAVATIVDGFIHIVGSGTVSITASQAGNENYIPAKDSTISLIVRKAAQTIIFNSLPTKTFGDASFMLDGYATSGLPLLYESDKPSIATVVGNLVTIKSAGSVVITAKQSGNNNISAAQNVIQNFSILKHQQSLVFAAISPIIYGTVVKIKPTVSSSEGLPVQLSSSNLAVAKIVNDSIIITGAGSALITASQNGNDIIASAQPISQNLEVMMQKQSIVNSSKIIKTIQFSSVDTKLPIATTSGLPVTISSETPNIVQIVNNNLHTVGTGIASIRIIQNGSAGISAIDTTIQITVTKAPQSLSFPEIPIKKVGMIPFKLFATSTSGYPVSYKSTNPAVADIIENEVTINGSGVCQIVARVESSDNYEGVTETKTLIVTALNTIKMPLYTLSRDSSIDLKALVLTNDIVAFSYVKGNHATAVVSGSTATILVKKDNTCWTGDDTLWFTATNKNVAGDIQYFGIKVRRIPLVEQIGLVTVDSSTSTKCIIAWERSVNAQIAGYIIYRGAGSAGKWDSIGYVQSNQRSLFIDNAVNVAKQAYQYAMVTVDSCGNRSTKSKVHTTMHLMTGFNLQYKPQLWWTPYEGTDLSSYVVYRKNQITGKLDSIGSSILTSFTDLEAPVGSVDYRVAIRFTSEINPDNLKADSGPFSMSLSNMAESQLTESSLTERNLVRVYPNPAQRFASLLLPEEGKFTVSIFDPYGRQVSNDITVENTGSVALPISQLNNGVYTIKIQGNDGVSTLKLIKE